MMTPPARRLWLSLVVLASAALLRLWRLDQAPPGFHVDEAFHLLNAQKIVRGEEFPVYLTGNYGNEPLFAYLSALTLQLVSPVTWAGRLASAWAGLVSVALTIRAGEAMFPRRRVGILAGLILATLYSHLHFSRYGSQPILTSLAAAGTMAALWRGARTGSPWAYALTGLCLGLGLTAYLAFRLFPLAPLFSGLVLLYARPKKRRTLFQGGLLATGVALAVYAPLGLFFIQHPVWFFNRFGLTTEATLGAVNQGPVLLTNALKTVGGLFLEGDVDGRYNLPARPALDAIQSLLFAAGLVQDLRRWRQPEAWALLAWLGVGLLPSALTEDAPQFGRTTMVTPALALIAALGVLTLWQFTRRRISRALLVAGLALSATLTIRDYFGRYASAPDTFMTMNGDELALAHALRAAPDGAQLYATPLQRDYYLAYVDLEKEAPFRTETLGNIDRGYWSIEYLIGPAAYQRFGAFNGRECLILPARTTALTVYAVLSERDVEALPTLEAAFPGGVRAVFGTRTRADDLRVETYFIPAGRAAQIKPAAQLRADFGGIVELAGFTLDAARLKQDERLSFSVVWNVKARPPAPYKNFVHLLGPPGTDGSPILGAQRDAEPCLNSYPTWQWTPGELVIERYSLWISADAPAGAYRLHTGWYDAREGGARLPAVDAHGQPLGDSVSLGTIQIIQP